MTCFVSLRHVDLITPIDSIISSTRPMDIEGNVKINISGQEKLAGIKLYNASYSSHDDTTIEIMCYPRKGEVAYEILVIE